MCACVSVCVHVCVCVRACARACDPASTLASEHASAARCELPLCRRLDCGHQSIVHNRPFPPWQALQPPAREQALHPRTATAASLSPASARPRAA
eukprot:762652-Pleurochrysis_carterae.AAC.1